MHTSISRVTGHGTVLLLCAVICSSLQSGCSVTNETHAVSDEDLNAQMTGRDAIIRLKDGRLWSVKNVKRSHGALSFQNRDTQAESVIPYDQIDQITTVRTDHVLGAMEGLGIGFAAPFLISMPIFAGTDDGGEIPWIVGPIAVGAVGGVVGLIVGAVTGFTYYDEFRSGQSFESVRDSTSAAPKASGSGAAPPSPVAAEAQNSRVTLIEHDPRSDTDTMFTVWDEQPKKINSVILLANLGAYYLATPTARAGARGVADLGGLLIVDARDAIGVSLFASSDAANRFNAGAGLRYRHRFDARQSLDLGIGMPVFGESSLSDDTPSFYGLVKWNPAPWFGIAIRPELRKRGGPLYQSAWPDYRIVRIEDPFRLHISLGIEVGGSFGR